MSYRLSRSLVVLLLLLVGRPLAMGAETPEASCFIQEGDHWAFHGDSITHAAVYTRLVERVFRHFHPHANVTFTNHGVWGKRLADAKNKTAEGQPMPEKPTVVSVMLGMNDAINSSYVKGQPVQPILDRYNEQMRKLIQDLKDQGIVVLLMTPTLTDETTTSTIFRTAGCTAILKEFGRIGREIARDLDVHLIPMQEEFETAQQQSPLRQQALRHDGVHPTSMGQYHMARILWQRLNLAGPLNKGERSLVEQPSPLPVTARLRSTRLAAEGREVSILFSSPEPGSAILTWSMGDQRGSEAIAVSKETEWILTLPDGAAPQKVGDAADVVLDLEIQGRRSVFVLDLFKRKVLHMIDGACTGEIVSDGERPEGPRVATYSFQLKDDALLVQMDVTDDSILAADAKTFWPWGGDAVSLYMDLRDAERFGSLAAETDVYQLWFRPSLEPFFSTGALGWMGTGLEGMIRSGGRQTEEGYQLNLLLRGWQNNREYWSPGERDFIGFHLTVIDKDPAEGKTPRSRTHELQPAAYFPYLFPGLFTVLDLKNAWDGDTMIQAHLFPFDF